MYVWILIRVLIDMLLSISHPFGEHFHQEVIQVIVPQPTGHHDLWAVKQLAVVVFGQ